jgi:outer membrane protein assembly factor BamB/tetratricopeptide (TPR) repeat protein
MNSLHTILAIILILGVSQPALPAERIKRIAILAFQNGSPDKTFDWVGIWLGETLHQEFKRVPVLTLVDRQLLSDITRELKLGKSGLIDPATAMRKGREVGADSLLTGSYEITGDRVQMGARVTDVETHIVRVAAQVSGTWKDLNKLQIDLAKKLLDEIHGAPVNLEAFIDRNLDAYHAFSDGVYFLRNGLAQDALREFDRALAIDRTYFEAQFYRGLALKKLERWEEAVTAFRRTLPRSTPERRVVWNGKPPFTEGATHGVIFGIDFSLLRNGRAEAQTRVIFGERKTKSTLLFLPDLDRRRMPTLEIPDRNITFNDIAFANSRYSLILSADREQPPQKLSMYAISPTDGRRLWSLDLPVPQGEPLPMLSLVPDGFLTYQPPTGRLTVFDDRTRRERWTREIPQMDKLSVPMFAGELMIAKTGGGYRALRLSDGSNAWTIPTKAASTSDLVNDRVLAVFEHDERFLAADINTGQTLVDLPIPQWAVAQNLGSFGTRVAAVAVLQGSRLYVVSRTGELLRIDVENGNGIRWRTPLPGKVSSLRAGSNVYAGTDTGELLVIDPDSGAVTAATTLAAGPVNVDYAANDIVVASAAAGIFGLEPSGKQRWMYPSTVPSKGTIYFKGVVAARTSATLITTLDAKTGDLLWHHSGQPTDAIHLSSTGFFIVEEAGIKEYAIDIAPPEDRRPSDKEVLTELAGALMAGGKRTDAQTYIEKVQAIDPDYPPLRWLLGDFAAYADLVGRDTQQGQQAIAELKRRNGLVWSATMDGIVLGAPIMIGEKIVNNGRVPLPNAQIVGLDASTGQTAWRQVSERMIDSVADDTGRLWYISGQAANASGLALYRLNAESGERQELDRWSRPFPINAAFLSFARGRLFVASVSSDFQGSAAHLGIDCFDATSGARLWRSSHDVNMPQTELQFAIGVLAPHGDNFVFSLGHEIWALNGADGNVVDRRREERIIGFNTGHTSLPDGPIYYPTDNREIVAYDVARKQQTRFRRPEMESPQITMRGGILFSFDRSGAYAFDVNSGEKWRRPGKFRSIVDDDTGLWALREDNVVQQLDPASGKVLSQYSTLWRPAGFKIIGDRFYAFTADGFAYCLSLKR